MKMSRMILIAFLCGFVISGGLIVKAVLFDGKQASGIDPASVSASQDPAGTAEAGGNQSSNPDEQSSAIGDPVASASADATSAGISASPPGSSDAASPSPGNSVSTSPNAAKTPAAGTITLAQLKAANGQNGSPAYVAYHGIVYSVSEDPAFINGIHRYNKNIKAGMDLSVLFDSSTPGSHKANDYISRLIPVGPLASGSAGVTGNSQNVQISQSPAPAKSSSTPIKPAPPAPVGGRVLTAAQLAASNGQNGAPAYIAYHNTVYDLAGDPAFINGVHRYNKNIKAGMDLTFLFDQSAPGSHRVNDYISRFILIGVMDPSYAGPDPNFILPGGGDDD